MGSDRKHEREHEREHDKRGEWMGHISTAELFLDDLANSEGSKGREPIRGVSKFFFSV